MKKIKVSNMDKSRYISMLITRNVLLLVIGFSFFGVSCKKEIKAGPPIALTYDQVYMVGNATSVGWDINNAIPMTPTSGNPNEFTWEGPLYAGEIKFPTALSWTSDTFMSATAGQSITDNKALLALNGNPDYHWVLADADAGNYKITLNTKDQTVTFQKE
ncbi:SusF/SusE family outer membrane protein [Ilyomonas limi]|uniref:SusF/SusE family outer membrane protein n=1 Tax=Ilyomonas limi TaxID=2575867 RepID=A0A4U3L404_9BACT|nr:SusF/SusE family outer membrane protein [Ilyomonas limi]TKK69815.1 SusF/SusE family outer membrane protein [Ilyomonas limi]